MMRKSILAIAGFGVALGAGLAIYWRWFPRAGLKWTNEVGNPWLVERGLVGRGASELGTIEHIGRRSGRRYLTPIHPVATADGFRIVVPLAERSEWAKNVLAAGHCRLQFHDVVYELDEPLMVQPADVRELPPLVRAIEGRLGFTYLRLHRFAEVPGALDGAETVAATPTTEVTPMAEASPTTEVTRKRRSPAKAESVTTA